MKKKVCIVTHVTSGVGQGSADALAKAGAAVVVNDRRFQKAADHTAYCAAQGAANASLSAAAGSKR